jgi:hypothetical protein
MPKLDSENVRVFILATSVSRASSGTTTAETEYFF